VVSHAAAGLLWHLDGVTTTRVELAYRPARPAIASRYRAPDSRPRCVRSPDPERDTDHLRHPDVDRSLRAAEAARPGDRRRGRDAQRRNLLRAAGWQLVTVTFTMLHDDPERVVATVSTAYDELDPRSMGRNVRKSNAFSE